MRSSIESVKSTPGRGSVSTWESMPRPFGVGEYAHAARQAAQVGLQAFFQAPLAGLFAIDGADDVRGQRVPRIVPPAFVGESDPVQVQAAQPFILLRLDRARHPHEAFLVGGIPLHAAIERGAVDPQHARQDIGGHLQIRHLQRIDVNGIPLHAARQQLSGAIEDGAARRGNLHCLLLLLLGRAQVIGVVHDLQTEQLNEDQGRPKAGERAPNHIRRLPALFLGDGFHNVQPCVGMRSVPVQSQFAVALGIEVHDLSGRRRVQVAAFGEGLEILLPRQPRFHDIQIALFVEQALLFLS